MHAKARSLSSIRHTLRAMCSLSNLFTATGMIDSDSPCPATSTDHAIYSAFLHDLDWQLTTLL